LLPGRLETQKKIKMSISKTRKFEIQGLFFLKKKGTVYKTKRARHRERVKPEHLWPKKDRRATKGRPKGAKVPTELQMGVGGKKRERKWGYRENTVWGRREERSGKGQQCVWRKNRKLGEAGGEK